MIPNPPIIFRRELRPPTPISATLTKIYRDAFDEALVEAAQFLQENSPKGISPPSGSLRGGWEVKLSRKMRNIFRFEGFLYNTVPTAINRLHGRGPGKFPPFAKGTPLARWAESKGIPPFLVARKIAREGTKRWREEGRNNPYIGINLKSRIGSQMIRTFNTTFRNELEARL